MKFILNDLNISFIKTRKQNVVYINNKNDDIINEYKEVNNNEFKI